jgi:hypothetical protein
MGENIFETRINSRQPWDGLTDFKILTELTAFPFHSVFEHWMERPEWMSKNTGDYYT